MDISQAIDEVLEELLKLTPDELAERLISDWSRDSSWGAVANQISWSKSLANS